MQVGALEGLEQVELWQRRGIIPLHEKPQNRRGIFRRQTVKDPFGVSRVEFAASGPPVDVGFAG